MEAEKKNSKKTELAELNRLIGKEIRKDKRKYNTHIIIGAITESKESKL